MRNGTLFKDNFTIASSETTSCHWSLRFYLFYIWHGQARKAEELVRKEERVKRKSDESARIREVRRRMGKAALL